MKSWLFALAACVLLFTKVYAGNPDEIVGNWMYTNERNEKVKIEIYKSGDRYFGKIVWLEVPNYTEAYLEEEGHPEKTNPNIKLGSPKIDYKNPDAAHQKDPVIGLVIMNGVHYNAEDNMWDDGTVYKADEGKTYTCFASLEDANTLKLKGYILGMKWLGKTRYWTRVK